MEDGPAALRQRQLLTRYHVTDAASFYSGQDFWRSPYDPTSPGGLRDVASNGLDSLRRRDGDREEPADNLPGTATGTGR